MTFNTAVSGLNAASSDLSVIGNNIANAATIGFKSSRAEFGDVYASSILGSGSNSIGSGVLLQNVSQQFTQGNISFTNNSLDLAINGGGFFILDDGGAQSYSRNGAFSLDNSGFVTASTGEIVQGFLTNSTGTVAGNLTDLQIQNTNLAPQLTQQVDTTLNVDARETPPEIRTFDSVSAGTDVGVATAGTANSYGTPGFQITNQNTSVTTTYLGSATDLSATAIAAEVNALGVSGLSASGSTSIVLDAFANLDGTDVLTINGSTVSGADEDALATAISALTNFSAVSTGAGGSITITESTGADISVVVTTDVAGDLAFDFTGSDGATTVGMSLAGTATVTAGGEVTVNIDESLSFVTASGDTNVFATTPSLGTVITSNAFDPTDADTYNHATSLTLFDSLGVSHILTQYFVKESSFKTGNFNEWTMHVQIDGADVGDPLVANGPATPASFSALFNSDGSYDTANSTNPMIVSYWNPSGTTSSLPLQGTTGGGVASITDPATNSNFAIDISPSTQFGSDFAVNDVGQDGYTTGRLVGVDIADSGEIFARFSNGQAQTIGQVALADFNNPQGLSPQGNTQWVETFESGNPVVGSPGSASLGVIQSGALEESNSELTEELVNLIIAQRNFQANAKTIQTADAVTQSIINIR